MFSTKAILLRLDPNLHEIIKKVSSARGQDMSNFLREIIKAELARLSFLTDFEKKALGVPLEVQAGPEKRRSGK